MTENLLILSKPWAGHEAGARLRVLAEGEAFDPAEPAVDPARAAWLRSEGFAGEPAGEPEKKLRKRKGGDADAD